MRTKTNRELTWDALPDAEAAAELMLSSWSENRESPLDYSGEILRCYFEYPGNGPLIAPALYDEGRLVAFVAGMPRTVSFRGEERKLLLMTFFTVAPGWKGHGLGVEVWAECLRQAREAGYHGAIHFCAEGNVSNHVTVAGARKIGLTATPISTVRFLMRLLTPADASNAPREASIEDFLHAADVAARHAPLARRWSRAEAEWQCRGRIDPICVSRRSGSSVGALTGYRMRSMDSRNTRCAFIEDVLWHEFAPEDRTRLLDEFLSVAAEDAQIAVVPLLDYADMSAFRAAGFRRAPRVLNAYLTLWNADTEVEVPSMYIDVL